MLEPAIIMGDNGINLDRAGMSIRYLSINI